VRFSTLNNSCVDLQQTARVAQLVDFVKDDRLLLQASIEGLRIVQAAGPRLQLIRNANARLAGRKVLGVAGHEQR